MLSPKRTKFRKMQKGRMRGTRQGRRPRSSFGDFGLQALEPGWLTARQIEAGSYRDDPPRQARRQDLHPRLPRQAGHQEAGRDPHG